MLNLGELAEKIKIRGDLLRDEPMSRHTTFRIGGPADLFCVPADPPDLKLLMDLCREEGLRPFILGAGANILVSDRGIRGMVIDLERLQGCSVQEHGSGGSALLAAQAGTPITEVCRLALERGFSGLEFIFSMPGSVGGSIWMNARCYSVSLSEVLEEVTVLEENGTTRRMPVRREDYGYKRSPFQGRAGVILEGSFRLQRGDQKLIRKAMENSQRDREAKGHFLWPCAGSVFKNNPAFGAPSGKLLDGLGLRGTRLGGAMVSERHANIIVNPGGATAAEVLELIRLLELRAREELGITLEREILTVGDWAEGGP